MELQSTCDHMSILESQLTEARAELVDIKAVATVTESTKQEAVDEIQRQWQEDIASLQAAMKGPLLCPSCEVLPCCLFDALQMKEANVMLFRCQQLASRVVDKLLMDG